MGSNTSHLFSFILALAIFFALWKMSTANTPDAAASQTVWDTNLSWEETKTNKGMGELLLKRLYARIESMEESFKAHLDEVYTKMKEEMDRSNRKCSKKSRKSKSRGRNKAGRRNQDKEKEIHEDEETET